MHKDLRDLINKLHLTAIMVNDSLTTACQTDPKTSLTAFTAAREARGYLYELDRISERIQMHMDETLMPHKDELLQDYLDEVKAIANTKKD